jgi:hypothetical protein
MATLQDILSGNFPAARRFAEGYAQMPSYLQDPYLGLSTSQVGNVTKGLLSKTQFEKAQEIASKNAETLLGLPKGNKAMDRAKAMGFDVDNPMYHGTNKKFTEFKEWQKNPNRLSEGIFFTDNPELAKQYGKNVKEAFLRKGNTASYDAEGKSFSNADAQDFLANNLRRLYGTSSVEMKNFVDSPNPFMNYNETPSNIVAVNMPYQIRSPNAAFDPARANEPDLLAALMAIPVSGLLEQPKDKKKKK